MPASALADEWIRFVSMPFQALLYRWVTDFGNGIGRSGSIRIAATPDGGARMMSLCLVGESTLI